MLIPLMFRSMSWLIDQVTDMPDRRLNSDDRRLQKVCFDI